MGRGRVRLVGAFFLRKVRFTRIENGGGICEWMLEYGGHDIPRDSVSSSSACLL